MTIEEKYDLAQWAIDIALENGANEAAVVIANSSGSSIELHNEKIDKIELAIEKGLTIRLFVNNKYAAAATNCLNKDELEFFIKETINGAQYLSEDEYRKLPNPELYYKDGGTDLKLYDDKIEAINPDDKIKIVKSIETEILGSDERIVSISTNYSDGYSERVMITSNGFKGSQKSSYFSAGASVSVKSDDARPSDGWYESSTHFDNLIKSGQGKTALKRALQKIGQEKLNSEKLPMLVENNQVTRILSPLISALGGAAIQQKTSFLLDKLDQKVISEKISIMDDPTIVGAFSSRHFDSEGLTAIKRPVFESGVLKTYFIDTYYANKMDVSPTTGSTSNLIFEEGDKNYNEIIKTMNRGIFITGFNGGNTNPTSGDFSFGIEGFLIENGEINTPISEMNITGNILDLWNNVVEIGNDSDKQSSWRTPSILFDGVDFSGI